MDCADPKRAHELIGFIIEHLLEIDSVEDLANRLSYSERHVRRMLDGFTDEQLSTILVRMRLERSIALLVTTDLPVWEIANQCHYRSVEAYDKAFRAHFHMTPTDVRSANRGRLPAFPSTQFTIHEPSTRTEVGISSQAGWIATFMYDGQNHLCTVLPNATYERTK